MKQAQTRWRDVPAPRRGELVRRYGNVLREHKDALGMLVTLETGKLLQEGLGEVQEMIDICDFAVGLSRQLLRTDDRLRAPGPPDAARRGIRSACAASSRAFNFPVAVWAWNAALALVCGDRGRLEAVGKGAAHRRWRRPSAAADARWPSSIPALADDRASSSTAIAPSGETAGRTSRRAR